MLESPWPRTKSQWNRPGVIDRFRQLVPDPKYSFGDMPAILFKEFAINVTRNACIGKCHRLGIELPPEKKHALRNRPHKNARPKKPKRPRSHNPKFNNLSGRGAQGSSRAHRLVERKKTYTELFGVLRDSVRDLPPDHSPFATTIENLIGDTGQCRWPVTTPKGEPQLFCADQSVPYRPYCVRHCHLAYQCPAAERRAA